jgi:hypothetical protein
MRSSAYRGIIALVVLYLVTVSMPASSLPLPRSACKLSIKGFTEVVESTPMQRVLFEGCLEMQGDPPRLFFRDPKPAPGCAIQFYYDWDPEIKLQIRVYEDSGPTAFNDEGWNTLIRETLEGLKGVQGELLEPFNAEGGRGTPMLGYVSLDCQIRLIDKETQQITLHRTCMVPVPEHNLVLMVGFFSAEKHFDLINSEFERFVRSLHRRPW